MNAESENHKLVPNQHEASKIEMKCKTERE